MTGISTRDEVTQRETGRKEAQNPYKPGIPAILSFPGYRRARTLRASFLSKQ